VSRHSDEYALVSGLVFACPFTMDNPPDCPLHDVRLQPGPARYAWMRSLFSEDYRRIVQVHAECLARKEHPR
jgi:hypothetical protein